MEVITCFLLLVSSIARGQSNFVEISKQIGSRKGYWSPWNYWTACSRTCGGGVTFRTRYCLHGNSLTDLSHCQGDSREYSLCNTEICPDGSLDFRRVQCSMYDTVDQYGIVRHWIPVGGKDDSCLLSCEKQLNNIQRLSRNFGIVVDGTPCSANTQRGVCIQGQCRTVGCNNQLDSILQLDSCGVCGGSNNSCGTFKGTFTITLAGEELYHYYEVVTFQPGTRNITVEEESEVNYLALSVGNAYYLNGDWDIHRPSTFTAAGAVFTYDRRRDGYERIWSLGPINTVVQISVIVRAKDPIVLYEFYLPPVLSRGTADKSNQSSSSISNSFVPNTVDVRESSESEPLNKPDISKNGLKHLEQLTKNVTAPQRKISEQYETFNKTRNPHHRENTAKRLSKTERRELCGNCEKPKGKVRNFCLSDFVVRAIVLDRSIIRDMTRYDVQILQTFTNKVMLFSREYFWVPNICNCPRLKIEREYIIMGNRVESPSTRENLLMIGPDKMVLRWKQEKFDLWNNIQSTSSTKCTKILRKEQRKARNKRTP